MSNYDKCPYCGYQTYINKVCMSCGVGFTSKPILQKDAAEERDRLILDSFGHLAKSPELIRSLSKGAEVIRRAEKDYREAVSQWLLYNQCAYGL